MSIESDICDGNNAAVINALDNGAELNSRTKTGDPLIVVVVSRHNIELLKELIRREVDLEARDTEGGSALHWAALAETPDALKVLIEAGADIQAADGIGNTPIYAAITFNRHENCRLLVEAGASLKKKNNTGKTPLHWCDLRGAGSDIRELLIANGADVAARDNDGYTPGDLKRFAGESIALRDGAIEIQKQLRDIGI